MPKPFLETFPNISFDRSLTDLLGHVTVNDCTLVRGTGELRVAITADRLIEKKTLRLVENKIRQAVFADGTSTVRLVEHFKLSDQYRLVHLVEAYRESLLYEIRETQPASFEVARKARWETEEETLTIRYPEGPIARARAASISEYVCKTLHERCGFELTVVTDFYVPEKKKTEETADTSAFLQSVPEEPAPAKETPEPAPAPAPKAEEKKVLAETNRSPATKEKEAGGNRFARKGNGNGPRAPRPVSTSDNPDVFYGRDFVGDPVAISDLSDGSGEVVVRGRILNVDSRTLKNEKILYLFALTDETDTIMCKIFAQPEAAEVFKAELQPGKFVILKGVVQYDSYAKELGLSYIVGIRRTDGAVDIRMDEAPRKRVELHCHTKMSDMDGVTEVGDLVQRAAKWGHQALAITDHGVVYSFPDAERAIPKGSDFKVIYGVEGYLVDDCKDIVTNSHGQDLSQPIVVFDIETTGLSSTRNKIIEIGAVRVENGQITDRFSTFVNPQEPIPFAIEELTHIDDSMVADAPTIDVILPQFLTFCEGAMLAAHNADFDMSFILHQADLLGIATDITYLDTVAVSRALLPQLRRFTLDAVAKELNVSLENHHRAVDDAECTALIWQKLYKRLKDRGITTCDELQPLSKMDAETVKKMHTYHVIILAKNDIGRINLYRLISMSHLDYFSRTPRIPRSEIIAHREGLIIGSACEAGELFRAVLRGEPDAEIARLVNFYDYLEIQPIGNNAFLLRDEKSGMTTEEDLRDLNRKIVDLGEKFGKPVVATCDVHFMDPQDEIYRRIIMAGKGFDDADQQAPLFLRTTEEMLAEFAYLGPEKAEEVVITNTNMIADQIEKISCVRPDKCPPYIENSENDLRDMCYAKAKAMYGDPVPEIVQKRLDKELHSIISNGYAVMYIIAQRLVKHSNDNGYLVGSRGSVGSSLAATMSGITEVNPLPPHYYCTQCHYSDFESEEVRKYAGGAGCDMPDKMCPKCGAKLKKDGFDIPFETFLGFKGDKEPDIDLNFSSGEDQSNAHDYTEVLFGKGHTFRAGTISTMADKTAFGYVKKYYEERGVTKRSCEIDRIAAGCMGVRTSSGQHPGGIVVLPHGEEINTFTPVQHPANKAVKTITTHFDYHKIEHNLLKLDILGHDDPTMIRMLQDLIPNEKMTEIPLDAPEVMSLFMNLDSLGLKPEDIGGTRLGALGIPEFGTDFAMQMVIDAKPTKFSDLVRIAGLAHGTDVWLGNAQTLIMEGTATIETAICTRDDIMLYLIGMGVEPSLSFTIMEGVRKGKGLKPDQEAAMREHGVPDWYIGSCKKIKYMFPKAHAAAYVMMAWRIAWCKVHYPLAYYAAFFTIRAPGFKYELMCRGKAVLEAALREYRAKDAAGTLSNTEEDVLHDLRIVEEMYARGYEFMPIDLYRAKGSKFQIIDGKIMPAFSSIDGLGGTASQQLEDAAKDGPFLSQDDLRNRAKISKTAVESLAALGILGDMPESNQLSLFDFM